MAYGGGPMYVSDLLESIDLLGPRMVQIYGQGESPMTITALSKQDHEGPQDAAHLARLASCGVARTGVEVRVVDESGRDMPPGEPGEVVTRSATRMLGYWNNPAATASAWRSAGATCSRTAATSSISPRPAVARRFTFTSPRQRHSLCERSLNDS